MQVEVEHHWLPRLMKERDVMLIDYFMTLNISHSQMQLLNSCRIFLQVLTLSNITSMDGRTILPNYIKGIPSQDRISALKWPTQLRPPASAWNLWRTVIAHFSTTGILSQVLGQWINIPHQRWI
jgi:hypothetical protein